MHPPATPPPPCLPPHRTAPPSAPSCWAPSCPGRRARSRRNRRSRSPSPALSTSTATASSTAASRCCSAPPTPPAIRALRRDRQPVRSPAAGSSAVSCLPAGIAAASTTDLTVRLPCPPSARSNGPGDTSRRGSISAVRQTRSTTTAGRWWCGHLALYGSSSSPPAAFHRHRPGDSTSDGASSFDAVTSQGAGAAACGAATPSHVSLQKTAAGSGAPGSTLLYTLTVRRPERRLGDGGLQLVDTVPANTTFRRRRQRHKLGLRARTATPARCAATRSATWPLTARSPACSR